MWIKNVLPQQLVDEVHDAQVALAVAEHYLSSGSQKMTPYATGAANDLAGATDLATRMVREFGMSPALGPVGFASGSPMYLGNEEVKSRPYAEATQRVIDEEVATLLREAEQRATVTLTNHRHALDRLTELLLERETIDGTAVADILGRIPSNRGEPAGATAST